MVYEQRRLGKELVGFVYVADYDALADGIVLYLDDEILSSVTSTQGLYALVAGLFLTIGVLSSFQSLSVGPVSVVTPIFGLFLVGSAVIGMVALGEAVTPRKLIGLGFAAVAVYLTST